MRESIAKILAAIFHTIGVKNKRDLNFWITLFDNMLLTQGKKNFTNLSRYGNVSESTIRRRMGAPMDWLSFNLAMYMNFHSEWQGATIGVFDCSYIPKSGSKTYGLGKFWSGVAGKALKGLEISVLGLIHVGTSKAWALDVQQTPGKLTQSETDYGITRLDYYLKQLDRCVPSLPHVKYWVADSFYAKIKVFARLEALNCFLITQLRTDANLYYLQPLDRKGKPGPKPQRGEKVDFADLSRWKASGRDFKYPHIHIYSQRLYSPHFQRILCVVLLKNTQTGHIQVLASSDPNQNPRQIVAYYQLRFQIEFHIRDAKQFGGLQHAQTRHKDTLNNHFNLSMATVNMMNILTAQIPNVSSKNSLIRVAYNTHFIQRIIHKLNLSPDFVNSQCNFHGLFHYGAFAA